MSRRIADRILLALVLFLIGTGIASAQRGRGGGGSFSGAPRVTHAPVPAAPFASGPSTFVRHPNPPVFNNPVVNPFPGRSIGVHHPPRVVFSQPFVGVYGGFYNPYIYGSPYYTSPAYIAPGYVAPGYVSPGYVDPGYVAPAYVDPSTSQSNTDLSYEVERLTREVEQLRQDQAAQAQGALAPHVPPPTQSVPPTPITLVFRDGRRLSVVNYAIIGQTLWVLDEQQSTKIPVSDLDLEATRIANPGQGLRLPSSK